MAFTTVLLDVDGTLIDSNDAHARAWVDALAQFGRCVAFERVRRLIGTGGDKLLAEAAGIDEDSPLGQQIDALRSRVFLSDHVPELRPFPGARDLLQRLHEDGLTLVVATSAKREEMDALLGLLDAGDLIDERTSSDDAEQSKPDPDIVRAALGRARAEPAAALLLGDTPYDVRAAQRAGVAVVAVRSGGWEDVDLGGALAIYDGTADLLARYDASPFARQR